MYENQKLNTDRTKLKKTNLMNSLDETDKYAIDLASEKGALTGNRPKPHSHVHVVLYLT